MRENHINRSTKSNDYIVNNFDARILFYGILIAFLITFLLVLFGNSISKIIVQIIFHFTFIFIGAFVFNYSDIRVSEKTIFQRFFDSIIPFALFSIIPYLILYNQGSQYITFLFWLGFVCVLFFSIRRSLLGKENLIKLVLTAYSYVSAYLMLSTTIFSFGIEPLYSVNNLVPIFNSFRLFATLLSCVTIFIYAVIKTHNDRMPEWPYLRSQNVPITANGVIFLESLMLGIFKVFVRILNLIILILNKIFHSLCVLFFYVYRGLYRIFQEIVDLAYNSVYLLNPVLFMISLFLIASLSIQSGNILPEYLLQDSSIQNNYLSDLIWNTTKIYSIALVVPIVNTILDDEKNRYLQFIETSVECGFLISLYFAFSGFLMWVLAGVLSKINLFEIPQYRSLGSYSKSMLFILLAVFVLYMGLLYFQKQKKK